MAGRDNILVCVICIYKKFLGIYEVREIFYSDLYIGCHISQYISERGLY